MTSVIERPTEERPDWEPPRPRPSAPAVVEVAPSGPQPLTRGRIIVTVLAWLFVTLLGIVLVLYNAGPLLQQRDQRALLAEYRTDIRHAANAAFGLPGTQEITTAPATGAPVGIVDIGRTTTRQVVVEGSAPQQTRRGPGHVVGTAGPGQPGNSVVVGRRSLFGGPFSDLSKLQEGDRILVTTVQGQTVYEVGHVGRHRIEPGGSDPDASAIPATNQAADAPERPADADLLPKGRVTTDELYGPSDDDRLTLITSASGSPWASGEADVVVATMDGLPFEPTPQGGRTVDADGRSADPAATAPLVLALLAYAGAVAAAVLAYRRVPWRSAYLLTAPPLVALTIVLAEQVSRALPAWA